MGKAGRLDHIVTAERVIDAPTATIFDLLADPQRHAEFDGSGMVQGEIRGPERLALGEKFGVGMRQGRFAYRSLNRVIEFVPYRRITWETVGEAKGFRFIGGQRWSFAMFPLVPPEGVADSTLVQHSYDWGAARLAPLIGLVFPRRMAAALPITLERLAAAATAD